jgi:hypothetical protein
MFPFRFANFSPDTICMEVTKNVARGRGKIQPVKPELFGFLKAVSVGFRAGRRVYRTQFNILPLI